MNFQTTGGNALYYFFKGHVQDNGSYGYVCQLHCNNHICFIIVGWNKRHTDTEQKGARKGGQDAYFMRDIEAKHALSM